MSVYNRVNIGCANERENQSKEIHINTLEDSLLIQPTNNFQGQFNFKKMFSAIFIIIFTYYYVTMIIRFFLTQMIKRFEVKTLYK